MYDLARSTLCFGERIRPSTPAVIGFSSDPRRRCVSLSINSTARVARGNHSRAHVPTRLLARDSHTRSSLFLTSLMIGWRPRLYAGKRNYDECLTDGCLAKLNPITIRDLASGNRLLRSSGLPSPSFPPFLPSRLPLHHAHLHSARRASRGIYTSSPEVIVCFLSGWIFARVIVRGELGPYTSRTR